MDQLVRRFRGAVGVLGPILSLFTILGASACSDITEPSTDLPIELRRGRVPLAASSGSIAAFGRTVIAVMVRTLPCNFESGASAALTGDRVDVTITLIDLGPIPCAALPGSSIDSVVVHGVPAGAFDASLHLRIVSGSTVIDSTIARQSITKGS